MSHLRRRAASRRHGQFDDANDACFIVRDHDGHALAYVYFENEAGQRTAANLLTQRRSAAPEVNDPFIVRDHNGHALAYVYFENEAGQRTAANLLTRDEARRRRSTIRSSSCTGPRRHRDPATLRDYSSVLKNQALANRVVDLTPKSLR